MMLVINFKAAVALCSRVHDCEFPLAERPPDETAPVTAPHFFGWKSRFHMRV
jgi:hypothetical protein